MASISDNFFFFNFFIYSLVTVAQVFYTFSHRRPPIMDFLEIIVACVRIYNTDDSFLITFATIIITEF